MRKYFPFDFKTCTKVGENRPYWEMSSDNHKFCVLMLMRKDGISAESLHSSSLNIKLT